MEGTVQHSKDVAENTNGDFSIKLSGRKIAATRGQGNRPNSVVVLDVRINSEERDYV